MDQQHRGMVRCWHCREQEGGSGSETLEEEEEDEEEEEALFNPKCTMHHISDTKLDIKQYTQYKCNEYTTIQLVMN